MPSLTRRQALAAIGSTSVTLAGCPSQGSLSGDLGQVDGTWPMSGRDSGHTRRADDGPTDPQTVWTTELDQVRAVGAPSLAGGDLYVPVDALSDRARHRYRIHALAASTGDERWQVPLRSEPNAPPAVSGDRIVVTARRALERGRIVCFRKRYGDEEWLFDVDARLTAAPTVDGTAVYVADWAGRVFALSVHDGSVRWSRQIATDGHSRTFTEPVAVNDGTLYLGSQSGATGLVAIDAQSGTQLWSESTGAVTQGPVVGDDIVAVVTQELVVAFDTDGTRRWSFNPPERDPRPVAVDDRHVYVPARGTLYAIDRNGERAWTYERSEGRVGTPTVAGDSVLVRGEDRLTALAGATGRERWTASPGGTGRAVVTREGIFLSGRDGAVVALGDG